MEPQGPSKVRLKVKNNRSYNTKVVVNNINETDDFWGLFGELHIILEFQLDCRISRVTYEATGKVEFVEYKCIPKWMSLRGFCSFCYYG